MNRYAERRTSGVYRGCDTCSDYREVLRRDDVDAVMISAPDHWHAPMAIAAAEAGKHVSLEKPITRTIAEGQGIMAAMRKNQRVFRMDSEMRSETWLHRMVEIVRNGGVGKITAVRVGVPALDDVPCPSTPPMPIPVDLDYDMWLGPAADQLWNVLQRFEVTYRMADGTPLYYENTRNPHITGAPGECTAYVKIEGTRGWITASYAPHQLLAEPASLLEREPASVDLKLPFKSDKQDFIDAIKTGGRTLEDEEVAHRTTSLCHLGHIAIHLGQRLPWDPQQENFVGNDSANAYLSRPILAPPAS